MKRLSRTEIRRQNAKKQKTIKKERAAVKRAMEKTGYKCLKEAYLAKKDTILSV